MKRATKPKIAPRLQRVAAFLDGSASLGNRWYGESYLDVRPFWWRAELRQAIIEEQRRLSRLAKRAQFGTIKRQGKVK